MKWRFIYRGLKARYRDQRLELLALSQALRPTDIAIDVGANKGSYLWALSRAVPRGRVVAFEPQPLLADYLIQVCQEAKLNNVMVESLGVSNEDQRRVLAVPGGGATSPGASFEAAVRDREACKTIDVNVVTLDRYFEHATNRIGALKIDVEGHELAVLEGARELLTAHRPVVVCESERRHMSTGSVADVFAFFSELGYEGFFVGQGELLPVEIFDPALHQSEIGERFWDSPTYYNNFIFRPGKSGLAVH
jgi:FkbM family methyltransferase